MICQANGEECFPVKMLEWHEKYETGLPLIDEQHRSLFAAINDLHDAMISGQGKEKVQQTLAFLIRYTETHFRDEERIMALQKFPGLSLHKVEHEKLLKTAHHLEKKMATKLFHLPVEMASFLADWIQHHINEADLGFIKYMQSPAAARTRDHL
jgi:hemerythrin-like metal-binding protein